MPLQVWAATFDEDAVSEWEGVYQRGLQLLDPESQQRLDRYYHMKDRFRGLVSRILPRMLLKNQGVPLSSMKFGTTETGKPYIMTEGLPSPIAYNVTHDGGLIAMAFIVGNYSIADSPAYRVGVDVMKVQPPRHQTFASFVNTFSEQLTVRERNILLPPVAQADGIRRFYLIWTLKEAYTKALGLGLGFDFQRIEYDVPRNAVTIDGESPRRWEFVRFEVRHTMRERHIDEYVGIAARYVGDEQQGESVVEERGAGDWLKTFDAVEFIERALQELR